MVVTIKDSDVDGVVLGLTSTAGLEITGTIKVEDSDYKQLPDLLRGRPMMMMTLREVGFCEFNADARN